MTCIHNPSISLQRLPLCSVQGLNHICRLAQLLCMCCAVRLPRHSSGKTLISYELLTTSWMGGSVCNATSAHWKHSCASWSGLVCVICMCRDKTDTGTAIALEPWRPTPSGAHTSSIGPRTTILGGWKPPHSSMTAGWWIFVPILSHSKQ